MKKQLKILTARKMQLQTFHNALQKYFDDEFGLNKNYSVETDYAQEILHKLQTMIVMIERHE